jgi:hypothetical protein
METITIAATAEHGPSFSTLAVLIVSAIIVGLVGWQVFVRSRSLRDR